MRCNCCNRMLDETEIIYNEELGTFELCSTCLNIAMDAAFPSGYKQEEEETPVLDPDFDDEASYFLLTEFKKDDNEEA